jgi:hypothetical protein
MRSKCFIAILIFTLLVTGCAIYRYATPYRHFDHELHENNIVKAEKDCFTCHKVNPPSGFYTEKDPIKKVVMVRKMLEQIQDKEFNQGECHNCHTKAATKVEDAPMRCEVCHDNLHQVKPDSHNGSWKNNHAAIAFENGFNGVITDIKAQTDYSCASCHNEWFCVNCHNSRDTSKSNMHGKTFRISHVTLAVADPASCTSCHTAGYCISCHRDRR